MNYKRVRTVKQPSTGRGRSAGIDFYIPDMNSQYLLDVTSINTEELSNDQIYIDTAKGKVIMAPGAHILLPSGIQCDLESIDGALYDNNHGVAYVAHNRSSIAKRKRLDVAADVVDEDYQGEIHFSLVNTSNQLITLSSGEKILQFLIMPIIYSEPVEVQDELFGKTSERSDNGFGSTNQTGDEKTS